MLKSFNYTQQFTMAELDKFGDDRVKKIQEIMINGLLESMAKSNSLAMESTYDVLSNAVRITISIVNDQSLPERKPVDAPLEWEHKKETLIGPMNNLPDEYKYFSKHDLWESL